MFAVVLQLGPARIGKLADMFAVVMWLSTDFLSEIPRTNVRPLPLQGS